MVREQLQVQLFCETISGDVEKYKETKLYQI